eukprot:3934047-Rhodomonas_salina.2
MFSNAVSTRVHAFTVTQEQGQNNGHIVHWQRGRGTPICDSRRHPNTHQPHAQPSTYTPVNTVP